MNSNPVLTDDQWGSVLTPIRNMGRMIAERETTIAEKDVLIAHQREQIKNLRREIRETLASWDAVPR